MILVCKALARNIMVLLPERKGKVDMDVDVVSLFQWSETVHCIHVAIRHTSLLRWCSSTGTASSAHEVPCPVLALALAFPQE
jgi:hypothetical protein